MRRKTGNRFLVVFLIVTMLISMAPAGVFAADIPEAQTVSEITGSGTEADPYLISDGQQLSSLGGTTLTGCYRLTADIDMEGIDMRPINGLRSGTFDGGGFAIKNLSITSSGNTGLFAELGSGAEVTGVMLENCSITNAVSSGSGYGVGALAGKISGAASISNCGVLNGTIVCTTSQAVNMGGLVGYIGDNCTIESSFARAELTAGSYAYSSSYLGGLVGNISGYCSWTVADCYADVSIDTKNGSGAGLIGQIGNSYSAYTRTIKNSYAAADMVGKDAYLYGFAYAGSSSCAVDIENCYYDSTKYTGDQATNLRSAAIEGKSTEEMESLAGQLGGSFQNQTGSYPILKWQDPNATYSITLQLVPENAKLIFDGEEQQENEDGVYTFSSLPSESSHSYCVSQRDDITDYGDREGTIVIGKKDITQKITLEQNVYDMSFSLVPEEADLLVKDADGEALTPKDAQKHIYEVVNGTYTYAVSSFGYAPKEGEVTIDRAAKETEIALKANPIYTVTFNYGDELYGQECQIDRNSR